MKIQASISALLFSVCLPLHANAVAYSVTVSGLLDSSFTGSYDSSFGFDLSNWLGKSYSLQLVLDNDPAQALSSGQFGAEAWWSFAPQTSLTINQQSIVPGNVWTSNDVIIANDEYIPPDFPNLPAGVSGDITIDGLFLGTGYEVGCQGGACDWSDLNQIHETLYFNTDYVWNTLDSIKDSSLPDLLNAPPALDTVLYKSFSIGALRWNQSGVDVSASVLFGNISNISIVALPAVPEPQSAFMWLAGLGWLGWRLRKLG